MAAKNQKVELKDTRILIREELNKIVERIQHYYEFKEWDVPKRHVLLNTLQKEIGKIVDEESREVLRLLEQSVINAHSEAYLAHFTRTREHLDEAACHVKGYLDLTRKEF